jgi:DNA-binding Lrp family transcriptional regulator
VLQSATASVALGVGRVMLMVRAYVLISAHTGKALEVVTSLTGGTGILQVDAITGEYDVIARVEADDLPSLGRLIIEKVQSSKSVFKTITCPVVQ